MGGGGLPESAWSVSVGMCHAPGFMVMKMPQFQLQRMMESMNTKLVLRALMAAMMDRIC